MIEPQIMLQWFVDVNKKIPSRGDKSLKELMLEPVRDGKIKFYQIILKKFITTGLKIYVIGVFPVKYGTDIEYLFGTVKIKYIVD